MAHGDSNDRPNGAIPVPDWCEFCERHARDAAQHFASAYTAFLDDNAEVKSAASVHEYAKKFVAYFLDHFEAFVDQILQRGARPQSLMNRSASQPLDAHGLTDVFSPAPTLRSRPRHDDQRGSVSSESQLRILSTSNNLSNRASVHVIRSNPSSFDHGDYSDQITSAHHVDPESKGAKPKVKSRKSIFRRLSFRNFRNKDKKNKKHARQQNDFPSSDSTSSPSTESKYFHRKSKYKDSSKSMEDGINLECLKEGVIHQLVGEDYSGRTKWEKCRLTLMKTTGGYMLEFYCPPKAVKPKNGIFCFLINEARETTALEMPDQENTFVLKADNNLEYVLQAHDSRDMQAWLTTIQYYMKPESRTSHDRPIRPVSAFISGAHITKYNGQLRVNLPPKDLSGSATLNQGPPLLTDGSSESVDQAPPELPPRTPSRMLPRHLRQNSEPLMPNTPERYVDQHLREYPWFHGTLSRMDAAQLVLQRGTEGHGVFLVRQSETRKGEYVLTFNFQGRAKHLRMTINNEGQCRVQHLWFQTIFDMLEHFRTHPIPLESGGSSDVTLTEYVVALDRPHSSPGHHGHRTSPNQSVITQGFHAVTIAGNAEGNHVSGTAVVLTNNGSVRLRTESMENIGREQPTGHGRAIENHYSFV